MYSFLLLNFYCDDCQVQNLWKTIYKLSKLFAHPEFKGPLRAAITIKGRLEKFKVDMPVISAICNPGLKERHWDIMSNTVSCLLISF